MASQVPETGAMSTNGTTYSEDEQKDKNVDGPEVTKNEPSVNKDNAPQLDPDVSPPSETDCPSPPKSRKTKASFPDYGGCNSDPAESEECTPAFSRPKRPRIALFKSDDWTLRNYGKAPLISDLFADSNRPLPLVNDDAYGGGISTIVQMGNANQGNGPSATQVSLTVHPTEQKATPTRVPLTVHPPQPKSTHGVNTTVEITDKNGGCFPWFRK